VATLEMTPAKHSAGVVICSARLGTRDLEAPSNGGVSSMSGVGDHPREGLDRRRPSARLSLEGLDLYGEVLTKALGRRR